VCIASGIFVAQVPGPLLGTADAPAALDLLSTQLQEFSVFGNGTADSALSWQIWLTDGDVNLANFAHDVDLEGVATAADGEQFSFGAIVTINNNRLPTTSDPSQPGLNPICKQRIIQLGGIDVTFFQGGTLYVTVDPRAWFKLDVDFSTLPLVTSDSCLSADTLDPTVPADYALAPENAPAADQTCGGSGQPCCGGDGGSTSSSCIGSLTCTGGVCGPTYCIPNSNFIEGAGGPAGVNLFAGIQTAGAAAYSVRYTVQP